MPVPRSSRVRIGFPDSFKLSCRALFLNFLEEDYLAHLHFLQTNHRELCPPLIVLKTE